jgi:hypothetical protein
LVKSDGERQAERRSRPKAGMGIDPRLDTDSRGGYAMSASVTSESSEQLDEQRLHSGDPRLPAFDHRFIRRFKRQSPRGFFEDEPGAAERPRPGGAGGRRPKTEVQPGVGLNRDQGSDLRPASIPNEACRAL